MTADISKVELHSKKNNLLHKTNEISTERLIIRRGLKFHVTFYFSAGKNIKPESLELTVQTGTAASEDSGTKSVFGVTRKSESKKPWHTKVLDATATSVTLAILSPADASIGKYTLSVKTSPNAKGQSAGDFVLLFNPWCEKDSVFMANEEERQEYVMNENGTIYRGSQSYIHGLGWDFGQFEDDILDICLKILDLSPKCEENAAKDFSHRGDPVYIGRVLSAMINAVGDDGVLEGNWSGKYDGGACPSSWNGSVDILRQWRDSGYKQVKYGQCWVFAGVISTVLRCLGIPSRPVTNFRSAHDVHGNLSIDECYSDHGYTPMESGDSIWNFHVWAEAWMTRPDLAAKGRYDGWQVLDPTPQEESNGVYCCGPAAVTAVREGHTDVRYDVPFVFAEVNADRITWLISADGSKLKIHTEPKIVGHKISTRSVGSDERHDITDIYKYAEGTPKEREVFAEALKRAKELHKKAEEKVKPRTPPPPKVSVRIEEASKPKNGQDIDLVIRLSCPSPRKLLVYINAQGMHYNGTRESDICCVEEKVELLAKKEWTIPFKIPFSKYGSHIQGNNAIKVSVIVHDEENTEEVYMADEDISPEDPPIDIIITGQPVQFEKMQAEIRFDNPLSEPLTNCTVTVTASGLLVSTAKATATFVGVNQSLRVLIPFMPLRSGPRKMVVDFDCDQFRDIKGSSNITIKPHGTP